MQWGNFCRFPEIGKGASGNTRLKIAVREDEIDETAIFKKKLLMSSSPVALPVDSCWSQDLTKSTDTGGIL